MVALNYLIQGWTLRCWKEKSILNNVFKISQGGGGFGGVGERLVVYTRLNSLLRSRSGLQGFRSEIGYQIFDQVWNWVGKITDFGRK